MESIQMILDAIESQSQAIRGLQDDIKTLVNALREVTWSAEIGHAHPMTYEMADEVLAKFKAVKYEPVMTRREKEVASSQPQSGEPLPF